MPIASSAWAWAGQLARAAVRGPGPRPRFGAVLGLTLALALSACTVHTPTPTASPVAAVPAIGADQSVTFVSGGVTFHGSYRGPVDTSAPVAAVAIVVGTGGIDRNGTAGALKTQTYTWLADLLAKQGIASIRYDKLGVGETGLGPYGSDPGQMLSKSYDELRVQPARDALSFLADQPGVDATRLLLLGHSEGGAVSLEIATHGGSAPPLAGLLLVEPAYGPILDVVSRQFAEQMDQMVTAGGMTAADNTTLQAWMADGVTQIRDGSAPYLDPGPVPLPGAQDFTEYIQGVIQANIYGSDPTQMVITHAFRTAYGKDFDAIVPAELAKQVTVPTFISCGTKDFNTPCGDGAAGTGVRGVAAQFAPDLAQLVVIPDMVHVLRDTGHDDAPALADQLKYPFSATFEAQFSAYVAQFARR